MCKSLCADLRHVPLMGIESHEECATYLVLCVAMI